MIIIPIIINFFIIIKKNKINKINNIIINTLNDGFSGNSYSKYKLNTCEINYTIPHIFKFISNCNIDTNLLAIDVYNLINTNYDTTIRFKYISYNIFDKKHIENVKNMDNKFVYINIIKSSNFLGYSFYPWYANENNFSFQIFINKQSLKTNKKSIVHEMGHLFGLFHTFEKNINVDYFYKKYMDDVFFVNYNKKINQNYHDIPYHNFPTYDNPFNTNLFPINKNNELIHFCNFMNYGEDDILIQFSKLQIEIMLYFLNKYFYLIYDII